MTHLCVEFNTAAIPLVHITAMSTVCTGPAWDFRDSLSLSSSHDQQEMILSTDPEEEVVLTYSKAIGDIQHDIWQLLGTSNAHQQKEAAKFLLKLICRVTDRTGDEVIDGCQGLLSHSLSFVKASVTGQCMYKFF